ncbi:MAG: radical SAM protein, partial [Firmicutes bacterium]|nr:radical SAM protein [Bacillota bacterium]
MKKVAFHTLGCKVNQYETEALKERFEAGGYTVVPEEETADVYVINTCTVTNLADRKSRQFIRRAIKKNPDAIVAACGCYVQINPEEAASIPGVDLVVGTNGRQELFDKVEELMEKRSGTALRMVLPYSELTEYRSDGIISAMDGRSRAFIKIQEGCDRFCSYCLIPFARGRVRSRDADEILEEVRALVGKGFREIVLTGINTALYGRDDPEDEGKGFARLLDRIDAVPGDFRVRLSSLEPTVVSPSQVADVLDHERLCH